MRNDRGDRFFSIQLPWPQHSSSNNTDRACTSRRRYSSCGIRRRNKLGFGGVLNKKKKEKKKKIAKFKKKKGKRKRNLYIM